MINRVISLFIVFTLLFSFTITTKAYDEEFIEQDNIENNDDIEVQDDTSDELFETENIIDEGDNYEDTVEATNTEIEIESYAIAHTAGDRASLVSAISGVSNYGTITLTGDITNYTEGITVSSKSFTINLNGFTLNVLNSSGDGIAVTGGRTLTIAGPGTLNVNASGSLNRGISTDGTNSTFAVTGGAVVNASATSNVAVYAGFNSFATITGNAEGTGGGVHADYGGTVHIGGNATSQNSIGALSTYRSTVNVQGSVSGYIGAAAENGATINVGGNASGTFIGAQAITSGEVTVGGNATSTGTGQYTAGAMVYDGGRVFVVGTISGAGDNDVSVDFLGFTIGRANSLQVPRVVFNSFFWDEYRNGSGGACVFKRQELVDPTIVVAFVTRLYERVLNRPPDTEGLNGWVEGLINGTLTGAEILFGFYLSSEMICRGLTNEQYVENLYYAAFDRPSDSAGKAGWINALDAGLPRETVVAGFIRSDEFVALCSGYGILVGNPVPRQSELTRTYVDRLYRNCFGRHPDRQGFDGWVEGLERGGLPGRSIARSFIFSNEMENIIRPSNERYVEILYNALWGRPADAGGIPVWAGLLNTGGRYTREYVFNEFARSHVFRDLCVSYGIIW